MKSMTSDQLRRHITSTYLCLRYGMCLLALALPLVLWLGGLQLGTRLQPSMSQYYHTIMSDVFVGLLWAIGAALYLYKGFGMKENVALNLAGIFLIGVAMFPTAISPENDQLNTAVTLTLGTPDSVNMADSVVITKRSELLPSFEAPVVHTGCAVLFFLMIAYVCIFRAQDTLELIADPDLRRHYSRRYKILGIAMIIIPIGAASLRYWNLKDYPLTFAVEFAGVYVFAYYWWTKSRELAQKNVPEIVLMLGENGVRL